MTRWRCTAWPAGRRPGGTPEQGGLRGPHPGRPDPDLAVDTVELTLGLLHTVIASVPSPAGERHLLTVTAQGASAQVLEAWTRRLADDIHRALSTAS